MIKKVNKIKQLGTQRVKWSQINNKPNVSLFIQNAFNQMGTSDLHSFNCKVLIWSTNP